MCQAFSEAVVYDQESGLFELVNGADQLVSKRIRTALRLSKSLMVSGDPAAYSTPPPDNRYSVSVRIRVGKNCWGRDFLMWFEECLPLSSASIGSKEFGGLRKKDCPFFFKVIATMNTGTGLLTLYKKTSCFILHETISWSWTVWLTKIICSKRQNIYTNGLYFVSQALTGSVLLDNSALSTYYLWDSDQSFVMGIPWF